MNLSRLVFLVGLSSLALSGIVFWQRSNAAPRQEPYLTASAVQPAPTPPPIAVAPVAPAQPIALSSIAPVSPSAAIAQANLRMIATCNGQPGNANFRSAPSLAPGTVLGVVAQGQVVQLTGRTVVGTGGLWYEAIAPGQLFPSTDPAAQNRTQADQTGWISACFISQ